jgi:hypothetical protein
MPERLWFDLDQLTPTFLQRQVHRCVRLTIITFVLDLSDVFDQHLQALWNLKPVFPAGEIKQ